jgi:hypothetical protein
MDLGECPKLHDLALRADYENAQKTKDYYYDVDVSMKFGILQIFFYFPHMHLRCRPGVGRNLNRRYLSRLKDYMGWIEAPYTKILKSLEQTQESKK